MNLSYNKIGNILSSIILQENFGLFSNINLESLYMVETDISDDFIAKQFIKKIESGIFLNIKDLDLSHN